MFLSAHRSSCLSVVTQEGKVVSGRGLRASSQDRRPKRTGWIMFLSLQLSEPCSLSCRTRGRGCEMCLLVSPSFSSSMLPSWPPKCFAHMELWDVQGGPRRPGSRAVGWSLPLIRRSLMTAGLASGGEVFGGVDPSQEGLDM